MIKEEIVPYIVPMYYFLFFINNKHSFLKQNKKSLVSVALYKQTLVEELETEWSFSLLL